MAAMFVEFLFLVARPFPRLFASLSLSLSVVPLLVALFVLREEEEEDVTAYGGAKKN